MDDQTNPAADKTAAAALLSEGVFGVIDDSTVTFGGYQLLEQAGVPVTGGAYNGPEWYEQTNTNIWKNFPSMDTENTIRPDLSG